MKMTRKKGKSSRMKTKTKTEMWDKIIEKVIEITIIMMAVLSAIVVVFVFAVMVTVVGCGKSPRYTITPESIKVNLPKNIYITPLDPNDPIYKLMSQPPNSWFDKFGNSDRSASYYQHALARQQRAEFRKEIEELTDTQLWLMKVIGRGPRDPNDK